MADKTFSRFYQSPQKLRDMGDGTYAEVIYDANGGGGGTALVAKGYAQLSVTTSALLSSVSGGIPAGATSALIDFEGNAVRWRDDGTAPTTSVGMPLPVGQFMTFNSSLTALRFISQSGTAVLNVAFYG
jgi:hypothetical protein